MEAKADGILSLVLALILVCLWVVGSVLLLQRAQTSNLLKMRIPWLVIAQGVGVCMGSLTVAFIVFFKFDVPCFLFTVLEVASVSVFFISTLLRTFVIWFRFNLTHEVVRIAENDLSKTQALKKDKKFDWFTRNRNRIESGSLFIAFAAIFSLVIVPVVVMQVVQFDKTSGSFQDKECQEAGRNSVVLVGILSLVCFILVGDLFRRMWTCIESLGLFKEYRIAAAGFGFFIFAAIIRIVAPKAWNFGKDDTEFYGFYTVGIIIPGFIFCLGFLLFPLRLSYTNDAIQAVSLQENMEVEDENEPKGPKDFFLQTLTSIEGFEAFKKFLMAEFSVENLLFYKKAVKYRNDYIENTEPTKREAWKIYTNFFPYNSTFCINISSKTRENAVGHMEKWRNYFEKGEGLDAEVAEKYPITKTLYDTSAKEVFALMLDDSFRRFRISAEYNSLKNALREAWKKMGPRRKGSPTIAYVARAETFEAEESVIAVLVV